MYFSGSAWYCTLVTKCRPGLSNCPVVPAPAYNTTHFEAQLNLKIFAECGQWSLPNIPGGGGGGGGGGTWVFRGVHTFVIKIKKYP